MVILLVDGFRFCMILNIVNYSPVLLYRVNNTGAVAKAGLATR